MLCTCIINFGPLLQFQVNSFTHGEIMTRFYVTLTMEQYFIMARFHVTVTLNAVKEILWRYGIQMKLLRPNFCTVLFINFLKIWQKGMLFISFFKFFPGGRRAKDWLGPFNKKDIKKMYLNRVSLYPDKKPVPKCHGRGIYCRYLYYSK